MRYLFALGFLVALAMPFGARAENVDLAITANSIRFSKDVLIVGDTVRIYASVRNYGDTDATGQVFFYQGGYLIGKSQVISVLAEGGRDDVFVDYVLPDGSFNIRAEIRGANPQDTNSSNDSAVTPLYKALKDTDEDGILDETDNCVEQDNADQADMDKDLRGDLCDEDIDGDGAVNAQDDYPTDPAKTKKPEPVIEKKQIVVPAPASDPVQVTPPPQEQAVPTPTVQKEEVEPEPEVRGESDETTVALAAPSPEQQIALSLDDLRYGGVVQSPGARFSYHQVDWRTYAFEASAPLGGGGYTYAWDFGDGATSVQQRIVHAFPKAGAYTVTLAIVSEDGTVSSDAETLNVSFFHLQNPWVQAVIGALLFILVGLAVLIFKLRRGDSDDEV